MKNPIFIIFGYGTPENIFNNESYIIYLNLCFNQIYQLSYNHKNDSPLIIASGGPTSMQKPYKKTESEEIIKYLKRLCQRSYTKQITKKWRFLAEKKSISTLENFINTNDLLKTHNINSGQIYIFCDYTRSKRIKTVATKAFPKKFQPKVIAFDFNPSPNRFVDPKILAKKEKLETANNLAALKDPAKLAAHHRLFVEKFEFLRANPDNEKALAQWWKNQLKKLA